MTHTKCFMHENMKFPCKKMTLSCMKMVFPTMKMKMLPRDDFCPKGFHWKLAVLFMHEILIHENIWAKHSCMEISYSCHDLFMLKLFVRALSSIEHFSHPYTCKLVADHLFIQAMSFIWNIHYTNFLLTHSHAERPKQAWQFWIYFSNKSIFF